MRIWFNLKELENLIMFLLTFWDQAHNRTIATNNRTMGVGKFQLFGYSSYIIGYNCAKWATYLTRALGASRHKSGNKGKFEKLRPS